MTSTSPKPTVILVHGAWADGSSWQKVIPLLLKEEIPVIAVQNPTSSLADDAAATRRIMNSVEGPIVLVGHSWGGAVITEAGSDPKVKALVYVAAFAPKAGETVGEQVGRYPAPPGLSQIRNDGAGYLTLSEEGWMNDVGQDLPKEAARVLCVLQPPLAAGTFGDKVTEAAWVSRPTCISYRRKTVSSVSNSSGNSRRRWGLRPRSLRPATCPSFPCRRRSPA